MARKKHTHFFHLISLMILRSVRANLPHHAVVVQKVKIDFQSKLTYLQREKTRGKLQHDFCFRSWKSNFFFFYFEKFILCECEFHAIGLIRADVMKVNTFDAEGANVTNWFDELFGTDFDMNLFGNHFKWHAFVWFHSILVSLLLLSGRSEVFNIQRNHCHKFADVWLS